MTNEQQHRLEVILEDMNGKFDLLLEGHATVERMVDEHRAETRQDKRELQLLVQTAHDSLDTNIKGAEQRLDAKIDSARDELKGDIHSAGDKVDGHEARITRLEKKVA